MIERKKNLTINIFCIIFGLNNKTKEIEMKKHNNLLVNGKKVALTVLLAMSLGSCNYKKNISDNILKEFLEEYGGIILTGVGMYTVGFFAGRLSQNEK